MAFTAQKNFTAKINGKSIFDIMKKLDYKKTSLEERQEVVKEIFKDEEFFTEYFSTYFKVNINTNDYLSENINVCKALQQLSSYILDSDEVKQKEEEEKSKYVFYTDEDKFQKRLNAENSIEGVTGASGEETSNIIHFLKSSERNEKIVKDVSVTPKDFKRDDDLGKVLREYQPLLVYLVDELRKPESKENRFIISRVKGSIQDDMNVSKQQILGVFGNHMNPKESTKYNVDVFDFTNPLHLKGGIVETESGERIRAKGLLYLTPSNDYNDDFNLVLLDLQKVIDKANLTHLEKLVLAQLRKGITYKDIAQNTNVSMQKVQRAFNNVVKKVTRVGERYDSKEIDLYEVAVA